MSDISTHKTEALENRLFEWRLERGCGRFSDDVIENAIKGIEFELQRRGISADSGQNHD